MSTSEALNLVSCLVLLLVFGVLATASDVKDSEIDSIRLKTLPQVLPWHVLRWVLFSVIGVILGLTFFFLPNWLLGAIFFSAFSTYVLFRNWTMPISFDLDPGLLLFALGNLLYLR
jgi:Zn-dependent membrane protease YugP